MIWEFQTREAKPKAKQQRTVSSEDVSSLEVNGLAHLKSLNPQPPQAAAMVDLTSEVHEGFAEEEEADYQSTEDVTDFFCATRDYEQQDAASARQDQLDVDLYYNIEAAFWMGEYVTLGEEKSASLLVLTPTPKTLTWQHCLLRR